MATKFTRLSGLACVAIGLFAFSGCDPKPAEDAAPPEATPIEDSAAQVEATPEPTPEPTATPFVVDKSSQVLVLCYHRFEDRPRDGLAISPEDFRGQMQALKDAGIEVISMNDFLAWRRGEKNIPARSALITIDDGYLTGYSVAWPILNEFDYPFTMYIYTDYVKGGPRTGGQSMSWEQLGEMRDAGVDIASHTLTHSALNAQKGRSDADYREWLRTELVDSKKMIEDKLGIEVTTIAYPYGLHNETVEEVAMEAGYEAAFTVRGAWLGHEAPPAKLGRYAIESTKPEVFRQALATGAPPATVAAASVANPTSPSAPGSGGVAPVATGATGAQQPAPGGIPTSPANGQAISDPRPLIFADLSSLENVDPDSVEMRVSGFGVVPAEYDEATGVVSFPMHQRLVQTCTVQITARAAGRRVQTEWAFAFDPSVPPTPTPTPAPTPEEMSEEDIPEMIPAS